MRARIIWAVLAVVLVAWALMPPPAVSARVRVNRLVEHAVTTTPVGEAEWRPSVIGADVNFGDRLATAAASRLEVSLLDRSLLTVGVREPLARVPPVRPAPTRQPTPAVTGPPTTSVSAVLLVTTSAERWK